MNLLGREWLGRFLYLGEPGESDERNDCPFTAFLGAFLSSPKGPFTIPIPDRSYGVFLPKDRVGNPGGNIELSWKVDDGLYLIVEGN